MINVTFLLMSSLPLSFWTRTIYGTWIQQLLCHSTILLTGTLCPINTLKQQLINLEQVFSPLPPIDSKRNRLRVSFAFFRWNYLPNGRVNGTVATVEELSDRRKPGAMYGVPSFVMNCSCFQLQLFVLVAWFLLYAGGMFFFFKISSFVPLLWWFCVRIKTSTTTM